MRRILVTGASGFVGRHLLGALRAEFPGAALVAAGLLPGPPEGWDGFAHFDLERPETAEAALGDAPDGIIHLAARAAVADSFRDPVGTWRANLLGTVALAEATLRVCPGAAFVLASSAEVYGLSFRGAAAPLDEAAALRPANPYAASKAAADLAVGEAALRGLRAVRVRPFNHAGAGQAEGFVVAAFARQVAAIAAGKQEPVVRAGALDRWRDFLDVADVCRGHALALRAAWEGRAAPGEVFNLASGEPRRVGDTLAALCRMAGVSPRIEAGAPGLLRPTDVERTWGDASAARAALGWAPAVPWERTLATVLEDWRGRV